MAGKSEPRRISRRDLLAGAAAAAMAPAAACSGNVIQAGRQPTLRAADFRAQGADDLDVLRRAFAAWTAQGGGTLELERGHVYDLGIKRGAEPVFVLSALADARLAGNGATLSIRTVSDHFYPILALHNYRGLTIDNLHAIDLGYRDAVQGAEFMRVEAGYLGAVDLRLDNVSGDRLVGFLMVEGPPAPHRVHGIRIEPNCTVTRTYYALACQNQGDGIRGGFTTRNCRRSYLPYGVTDHDLAIRVRHDGLEAAPAAESCAVIKSTGRPTQGIRLAIAFTGVLPWVAVESEGLVPGSCVTLEHQPTGAGPSLIADVDLDIEVAAGTADPYDVHRVLLRSRRPDGEIEQGRTANIWRNIAIRGTLRPGRAAAIFSRVQPEAGVLRVARGAGATISAPGFRIVAD